LINVQLINAQTDNHLWAESYQRTLDNIFGVEGEVAQKVADALNARLTPAETVRAGDKPTQNPAAYDLFLRAEYLFNKARVSLDTAAMKPAIDLYQQAVAKDPGFALAWARLSYAQSSLRWFGGAGIDIRQLGNAARVNAQRALTLQPDLADANLAMGYSDYWGRRDYAAALKAFAAAQRARPNDTEAITASAYVLRRQGDYAAAIGRQQAALSLDPRNTELASNLAITYMYSRRYADAEAAFQRALALDPDNLDAKVEYAQTIVLGSGDVPRALAQVQGDAPLLKLQRAWLLTLQRKYREAIDVTESFADTPDNYGLTHQTGPRALTLGDLYLRAGDTSHAHTLLLQARQQIQAQLDEQSYNPVRLPIAWSFLADAELGLGNTDAALRAIRKSLELTIASHDHTDGPAQLGVNAGLYARIGRADLAVPLLEEVLASPDGGGDISPVMLQLDPTYDPIRNDPRYQALLKKYGSAEPATAMSGGGHG
jgi:tetratricopeptide (TPR) repeat protein